MAIRHIREVLDADTVNSSETLYIIKTWINQYKLYFDGLGYNVPFNPTTFGPNSGHQSGWNAVSQMGDDMGTYPIAFEDPDPAGTGNEQLGIHPNMNLIHLDHTIGNYGQAAGSFGNSGLKHLFHTVQFGKGASSYGISYGGDFMDNGSNAMTRVSAQNNTYQQTNLKFSDFHSVTKNDVSNTYVYGDSTSEQVVTVGAISIGDAASSGGGTGA